MRLLRLNVLHPITILLTVAVIFRVKLHRANNTNSRIDYGVEKIHSRFHLDSINLTYFINVSTSKYCEIITDGY